VAHIKTKIVSTLFTFFSFFVSVTVGSVYYHLFNACEINTKQETLIRVMKVALYPGILLSTVIHNGSPIVIFHTRRCSRISQWHRGNLNY